MEKFKYGPLRYVTPGMEDDEGNYYWNGLPPVGYDNSGVPIDQNGLQCLDVSCPLHPSWDPAETEYNDILKSNIPSINYTKQWFEDNFLVISDNQIKKCIIKWWHSQASRHNYDSYIDVLHKYSSVKEIMEAVWPQEEQIS